MPYIKDEDKKGYYNILSLIALKFFEKATSGELNYLFTMIALEYISRKGEKYEYYNDIIGALENCKLELYRRKISKYEDIKIKENGDCYYS